ncbi:nucleotidyltransferase [Geranomyces variabilis]|nr:nucleotidyltransferase [Geranomyces variabilis]
MPKLCVLCNTERAVLKRPKTAQQICRTCFYQVFETEIHNTILDAKLFARGDRVAIAASGGKDSTVLAHVMTTLNERYDYGLDLCLLSVDEGITGYRDDSLETVKRNETQYQIPLKIVSYEELYGWSMDAIVKEIGMKNNCTFCGVFRRQALDRGAALLKVDHIVTGHNADDIAETVLMNIFRGDISRLQRCTAIRTATDETIPRSKPFKYTYEKEIVMYAYFKKLDYFSTECIYSPNAYRGYARAFLKDLEAIRPSAIMDIIHSGEAWQSKTEVKINAVGKDGKVTVGTCERCGYMSSQKMCKACVLLEGLNSGLPKVAIGNSSKYRQSGQSGGRPSKRLDTPTGSSPDPHSSSTVPTPDEHAGPVQTTNAAESSPTSPPRSTPAAPAAPAAPPLAKHLRCRKCRTILVPASSLTSHEQGSGQQAFGYRKRDPALEIATTCSAFHVSEADVDWIDGVADGSKSEDKIACPNAKCGTKLGAWSWAGAACSCGTWIAPSFAIAVNKVDETMAPVRVKQ